MLTYIYTYIHTYIHTCRIKFLYLQINIHQQTAWNVAECYFKLFFLHGQLWFYVKCFLRRLDSLAWPGAFSAALDLPPPRCVWVANAEKKTSDLGTGLQDASIPSLPCSFFHLDGYPKKWSKLLHPRCISGCLPCRDGPKGGSRGASVGSPWDGWWMHWWGFIHLYRGYLMILMDWWGIETCSFQHRKEPQDCFQNGTVAGFYLNMCE